MKPDKKFSHPTLEAEDIESLSAQGNEDIQTPDPDVEPKESETIISDVTFTKTEKGDGRAVYKSSDPEGKRPIIVLSESSPEPRPGVPYKVRVLETEKQRKDKTKIGKMIVELVLEQDDKARELLAKAKELREKAQTVEDAQELNKLYQEVGELYEEKGTETRELESSFSEQYKRQVEIMQKTGILDILKTHLSGEKSITAVDGKDYALPAESEVAELLEQNERLVEMKREQGFTKLLLVPFGMKLDELAKVYGQTIVKHFKENKLFDSQGKQITDLRKQGESDGPDNDATGDPEYYPLWEWENYTNADKTGELAYFPKEFSENHGGKTKEDVIAEQGGWRILLIENMPNIPREGNGKTINDRKQLEANKTPNEYLELLENSKVGTYYFGEQGMTPEDQLMYAITHLEETDQVVDDYQGNGSVSYQIGAYFPSSGGVPYACWSRVFRQAYLGRSNPDSRNGFCGARSAVRISKNT